MASSSTSLTKTGKHATRIPKSSWDKHWPEIERLWVQQSRPLTDVIAEMKKHDFHANETQYLFEFKKRKVQRNIKKQHWLLVLRAIQCRARKNKRSRLKVGGRIFDDRQIAHANSHYGRHLRAANLSLEDCVEQLPDHFEVYTPASDVSHDGAEDLWRSPVTSTLAISANSPKSPNYRSAPLLRTTQDPVEGYKPFGWLTVVDRQLTMSARIQWLNSLDRQFSQPLQSLPLNILNAMFWQSSPTNTHGISPVDQRDSDFLLSALVNDINHPLSVELGRLQDWSTKLSQSFLRSLFRDLPTPFMSIIREKIFLAAIGRQNEAMVRLILSLGLDPREEIAMEPLRPDRPSQPIRPLRHALFQDAYTVAKLITVHICEDARENDRLLVLQDITSAYSNRSHKHDACPARLGAHFDANHVCSDHCNNQWISLLDIVFGLSDERKDPRGYPDVDIKCLRIAGENEAVFNFLANLKPGGARQWLSEGLLLNAVATYISIESITHRAYLERCLKYMVNDHARHPFLDEAGSQSAVKAAFSTLPDYSTKGVQDACTRFNFPFPPISYDSRQTSAVPLTDYERARLEEDIIRHIAADDVNYVLDQFASFEHRRDKSFFMQKVVSLAKDEIVLALTDPAEPIISNGFIYSLSYGRTEAVSDLLQRDTAWSSALHDAIAYGDYCGLDDLIFRDPREFPICDIDFDDELPRNHMDALLLRGVAYHAIHLEDRLLLEYTIDAGLDGEELALDIDSGLDKPKQSYGIFRARWGSSDAVRLPSLLSIAMERDDASLLKFLLDRGLDSRDPFTLIQAIRKGTCDITINTLLDVAVGESAPYKSKGYGSGALCEAVRRRDYTRLHLLAGRTDIHGLEHELDYGPDHASQEYTLSALGESVLLHDVEAAGILLKYGADPNVLVAMQGLPEQNPKGSVLRRVSPILAAVEVGYFPMLKFLCDRGAEINPSPRDGVTRTALQRAAEIGDFEAVQFLLEQGADVNYNGLYGGASALQFAAIGGYVGIARLLVEYGAQVNSPPGKGDGRTAFEGAAEWGRLDMVTYLFSLGATLNLVTDPEGHTQGARAIRFAKERGHVALMHYVEGLCRVIEEAAADLESPNMPDIDPIQPGSVFEMDGHDLDAWAQWTVGRQ